MKKAKDLTVLDYKYEKKSIIQGYYYFKLDVDYEDNTNAKLKRRYSQIEELYKVLLLTCPGCLIPKIKKSKWNFNIKKEEKSYIISNVEKFLLYLIKHPILMKNKSVLYFFSEENTEINRNQKLKTNKMGNFFENDNQQDENDVKEDFFSSSELNEKLNKSDNVNINKNNLEIEKKISGFEIIEKEDYKDLFEEHEESELLNMFIEEEQNNKNRGFLTNIMDFFISMYKYDTKSNQNQEVFEFINNNSKNLGENFEINKYGIEIMRYNEGYEYIINNLIKEYEIIDKKTKSLNNIIGIFREVQSIENKNKNDLNKKNDNNIDDFETIKKNEEENSINESKEENKEKDLKEKWDKKLLNGDINKIKNYTSINQKFIKEDLNQSINKIIELKDTIENLCDIFERKKDHIQFLSKLQSKLNEIKKQNDLIAESVEKINKLINDKFLKKKIEKETLHINKLNQNLKYEIDKFKKEQGDSIYTLITDLYKKHYLKQSEIFDIINREISFDSDSENSSKIKEHASEDSSQFLVIDDINDTSKNNKKKDNNTKDNNSWDNIEDEL